MPKQYRPSEHEARVAAAWDSSGAFHADPTRVSPQRPPFCIFIPPPNVTGALHLGHALNNTLQDILTRAHRMMGFETLWMPGTDHAGIATQAVVERRLRKEGKLKGPLKQAMTREAFVEQVQTWKDEYEATITGQLKAMGCSCDFARQRFTMDDQCAAAVREAFFRLFRDGLIYRGKRLVNWDPALQTAVADDECYDEEIDAAFYYLRYPLVRSSPAIGGGGAEARRGGGGPSGSGDTNYIPVTWGELARLRYPGAADHPGDDAAWLTVATTRPETYLGDTAVAVNPHDPRATALRGLHARLPLVGRVIPIVEDSYVVLPKAMARTEEEAKDPKAEFATGFLKVTPAHDQNDNELYQRHKAAIDANFVGGAGTGLLNMMSPDGRVSDKHGWSDLGDAHIFVGKTMAEARKLVVKEFETRALLEGTKPYRQNITFSDRSKAVIEPYLSDQWYVRVTDDRMRGWANDALVAEQRESHPHGGTGVPPVASGGTGVPPVSARAAGRTPLEMSRRNLPHWRKDGSTYFVTFRTLSGVLSDAERRIALDAATHWHNQRAIVYLVTVMPDHVHILLEPLLKPEGGECHDLSDILQSIKSFSSHEIGKHRGRGGSVWLDESFDRIVRDADEFEEKWNYMLNNPVKEGLAAKPRDYQFTASPWEESRKAAITGTHEHRRDACATGSKLNPADAHLRFHPARYAKTYETWHDNIRDWCISRQLWWGHRIPVWSLTFKDVVTERDRLDRWGAFVFVHSRYKKRDDVAYSAYSLVSGEEIIVRVEDSKVIWHPAVSDPFVVIACLRSDDVATIAELEERGFARDPDVLDTWFSSALWPLSTLGWPDPSKFPDSAGLLEAFNPSTVLSTAREIITLWVSRMVMFNRYFTASSGGTGVPPVHRPEAGATGPSTPGQVPFHNVFIHAVVQDGDGKRMSKSAGNGVDPLDIISSHGADALRFTMCQLATNTQDVRLPVTRDSATGKNSSPKFDQGRNFANKLWNAARFAMGMLGTPGGTGVPPVTGPQAGAPAPTASLSLPDRWMLSRLASAIDEINRCLREYDFAGYGQAVYDLLWRDFCDWYLEAIKPTVATDAAQRAVLRQTLDAILRLLHPVIPFVTEVIAEQLRTLPAGNVPGLHLAPISGQLCLAAWPKADASLRDPGAEAEFELVRGLVTVVREVRAQHDVAPKRKINLHGGSRATAKVEANLSLVMALAGIDKIDPTPPAAGTPAVATRFEGVELHLSNLADAVDAGAERERLTRRKADLEKSIGAMTKRLESPGYTDKAPAKLVEETRTKLAKEQQELAAVTASLGAIGG